MIRKSIPLGLAVFGLLFIAYGVRIFGRLGQEDAEGWPRLVAVILGGGSIGIGVGLWRRNPMAPQIYFVWAGLWLLLGAWHELLVSREPTLVVGVWLILMAALYGAVGLYLRSAVKQAPQAR
jgi:hypothetical protein